MIWTLCCVQFVNKRKSADLTTKLVYLFISCKNLWIKKGRDLNKQGNTSISKQHRPSSQDQNSLYIFTSRKPLQPLFDHYSDVIISAMASQITSLTIVYSTIYSRADQRKHQSSASLAFVRGIHRRPVNSPHNGPVTRKIFPFHDVIMNTQECRQNIVKLNSVVICDMNSQVV